MKNNKRNTEENIYIEKAISYCKENNINLIIVVTPVRSDYGKEANKYGDYKSHFKDIIDISAKNEIPLLFYDEKTMDYDDFGDFDHLAEQGAVKFSKILKNDINKITS